MKYSQCISDMTLRPVNAWLVPKLRAIGIHTPSMSRLLVSAMQLKLRMDVNDVYELAPLKVRIFFCFRVACIFVERFAVTHISVVCAPLTHRP